MLFVKTKLAISDISGIGLFADQDIKKGDVIWQYHSHIDVLLCKEAVEQLSEVAKQQFLNYAYFDVLHNAYLLCGDDSRFLNHSDNANCLDSFDVNFTIAARDITAGEEITINYFESYGDIDAHPEIGAKKINQ